MNDYRNDGYFGRFGGKYVAEVLRRPLDELETAFYEAMNDEAFRAELDELRRDYIGRETPLLFAENATRELGGGRIYIKMEGLAHTGAHKINNALAQALLAKRMGKTRIIAETGAGQHGLATAAACAKLGLACTVYMGEVDVRRQQPNVAAMELYGAEVRPVASGSRTLKDAINEAMRDWAAHFETTHYLIGSALGPAPFPDIVRTFQSVIGEEVKKQAAERHIDIAALCACVGGGSNAIGFFAPFIGGESAARLNPASARTVSTAESLSGENPLHPNALPRLLAAEAGGIGSGIGENAVRMSGNAARDGIVHGYKSRFLLTPDGQVAQTRSISAGLDYPGIGPQLAALGTSGRIEFSAVRDDEALAALAFFAKHEGVLFALESAHAGALAMRIAQEIPRDKAIIINMSGRGDKDIFITSPVFRPAEWRRFLKSELARLESGTDIHQAESPADSCERAAADTADRPVRQ
ncbi:tryptophan synthase subunit beta [Treponema brennaborense]|uniref:Tryptophan synthase beta chain n=1 Tax=Treponema brennaborense (strain DSM 12168 / CIP 105900 / DD5/3) TaxID=906968 RepID=F4LPQ2_TREBD|nr:tryptophan synthase subunit beta [Treponema brennaborense]AEE17048.1 Tryptophan synthase beta chain [Treponema brennaborense DSM 12168]